MSKSPQAKSPSRKTSPKTGDYFAAISPRLANDPRYLPQLTFRELTIVMYLAAMLAKARNKKKKANSIPVPSTYQMLRLFTDESLNNADYGYVAEFLTHTGPKAGWWRLKGDNIVFTKRFVTRFARKSKFVRVDINTLLSLPRSRRAQHGLMYILILAWGRTRI